MKNKKIAVLAVAAALSMGSLTAAAHGTDNHGTSYERLDHNQVWAFGQWCQFGDNFRESTRAGNSYDKISELTATLVHKVDYDEFMSSKFAVQPVSHK